MKKLTIALFLTFAFQSQISTAKPKIDEAGALERAKLFIEEQVSWSSQATYTAKKNDPIWFVTVTCDQCVNKHGETFSVEHILVVHSRSGNVSLFMTTKDEAYSKKAVEKEQ
jgi:hypothetical protein